MGRCLNYPSAKVLPPCAGLGPKKTIKKSFCAYRFTIIRFPIPVTHCCYVPDPPEDSEMIHAKNEDGGSTPHSYLVPGPSLQWLHFVTCLVLCKSEWLNGLSRCLLFWGLWVRSSVMTSCEKPLGEQAAPVRLCSIDGTKQTFVCL